MSTARCDDLARQSASDTLFALRAHGRRAACAPSEELVAADQSGVKPMHSKEFHAETLDASFRASRDTTLIARWPEVETRQPVSFRIEREPGEECSCKSYSTSKLNEDSHFRKPGRDAYAPGHLLFVNIINYACVIVG